MLLISVEAIREQLGFDDMVDINDAIKAAGHAATAQLSAQLDTDFALAEMTDLFWVDRPGFTDGSHSETQFRLSRGLIVGDPVYIGGVEPLNLGVDSIDYGVGMRVNRAKGVVTNIGTRYTNQYVSITYTAGFDVDDNDADTFDQTSVPTWLLEAAKLQTLLNVADNPAITEANITIDVKAYGQNLASFMSRYIRYAPAALLPV